MAEYIEKEVALSIYEPPKSNRHYQTDNLDDAYGQGWDDALCSIERISAAGVAPVVHGEWIHHDDGVVTCSECGNAESSDSYYCRYCGAKMDGGADHAST